jgi:hypothetical protein
MSCPFAFMNVLEKKNNSNYLFLLRFYETPSRPKIFPPNFDSGKMDDIEAKN